MTLSIIHYPLSIKCLLSITYYLLFIIIDNTQQPHVEQQSVPIQIPNYNHFPNPMFSRNEYDTQAGEVKELLEERYNRMDGNLKAYNYDQEMKNSSKMTPVKYQKINTNNPPPSFNFESDLIFSVTNNSDYLKYDIETLEYKEPVSENVQYERVPTPKVAQMQGIEEYINEKFGRDVASGNIQAKKHFTGEINQLSRYKEYFYVLRKYTFYFYLSDMSDSQEFSEEIMERSIDTNMENRESFAVTDNFYVRKDNQSRLFRKLVTDIAYWRSYLMLYALQDQPPNSKIREFVEHEENHLIMESFKEKTSKTFKYESEIVFTFLNSLLENIQERKSIKLIEMYFPRDMLYMQNFLFINDTKTTLKTNIIPPKKHPLQQLHLVNVVVDKDFVEKLQDHLQDIFPHLDQPDNTHRVFSLTNTNLDDNYVQPILKKLSRPLKQLNLSKNRLSNKGICVVIQSSNRLETSIIDVSYNQPASKVSSIEYIKTIEEKSPCVKVLKLRGSTVTELWAHKFFHALAESHWLNQIEIQYESYYDSHMVSELKDFSCQMLA